MTSLSKLTVLWLILLCSTLLFTTLQIAKKKKYFFVLSNSHYKNDYYEMCSSEILRVEPQKCANIIQIAAKA